MRLKMLHHTICSMMDDLRKTGSDKDPEVFVVKNFNDESKRIITHAGLIASTNINCGTYINLYATEDGYVRCPESTNIEKFSYSSDHNTLIVVFKNGGKYMYANVPEDVFGAFILSASRGKFLNTQIKNKFLFEKIDG